MSVSFKLRTRKTVGKAPLVARIQSPRLGVNLLLSTHLEVDIILWNKPHTSRAYISYINSEEGQRVMSLCKEIKQGVESLLYQEICLTSEMAENLINNIVYRKERLAAEQTHNYVNLNQFISQYISDIISGARQTDKGTNYVYSTIKSIRAAVTQFNKYQIHIGRRIDFQDIDLRQKKTGAKISIPVSSGLRKILDRYNYKLPHLEDQVLNRYIKEICRLAGLDELIEIQTTKGGIIKKEYKHKWELVHSHTARRTGATLMYLAGMDYYDIMRITGHQQASCASYAQGLLCLLCAGDGHK